MSKDVNIFWFRRDLRLHDNRGLYQALRGSYPVLPLFIFDKHILDLIHDKSDPRVSFIHQRLAILNKALNNYHTRLEVRYGDPSTIFRELLNAYNIKHVFSNHDYEPYARERDFKIEKLLSENGVQFTGFKDQVIFEKNQILNRNRKPYTVFTPYSKCWREQLSQEDIAPHPSENYLGNIFKQYPLEIAPLSTFGFNISNRSFPGSEIQPGIIRRYHNTRDFPGIKGTSRLGIHLRFGTVSIRELVRSALELNEVWLSELIWREFFTMILWHFPQVIDKPFKKKYDAISWRDNGEEFNRWCHGETGYPIVDAGMRELNKTGYMHNRIRMITASFLTKHLLIDWRLGEKYFAEKLLDYELSSNNGNWQWVAGCGVDAVPYFRIFNPQKQTEKYDPDHRYIKKWVPEYLSSSYPRPMVDHRMARQRALDVFASVVKT